MRPVHGDDYGIACCVSSMVIGKEMQFFGARANLAKCLLYALNGGIEEKTKKQVGPKYRPYDGDVLDYDKVMELFIDMVEWQADVYVNTLNVIHYMHDKYCYERAQMALHDRDVLRYFATGIAGLSVVADSLSAIKYAQVKVVRDEDGINSQRLMLYNIQAVPDYFIIDRGNNLIKRASQMKDLEAEIKKLL
mgnify:CR=1 FL=1